MMTPHRAMFDSTLIKPGDIIGFSGFHLESIGINLATYGVPFWSISHVGIMGESEDGRLLLFESTTLDSHPCAIQGKHFNGTQAHQLDTRLATYKGRIWHYPLYRPLYAHERQRLNKFLNATIGIQYDNVGAFRAGGLGFSTIESYLRETDLSAIFCSEWCAAAHTCIGLLQTDNVSHWSPNYLCRYERRLRILRKPRRLPVTV